MCRWEPRSTFDFISVDCDLWYNIAKVVCAAESQQSAFDFISADCDLCGSGEVSFRQWKSEAAERLQLHGILLRWQRNPGCNCDLLFGFHGVIERPLRACSYMDFCCDGNVTLECNYDHGWGWWFPEHSHQRYFLYFQKLFSMFSMKIIFKSIFTGSWKRICQALVNFQSYAWSTYDRISMRTRMDLLKHRVIKSIFIKTIL